MQEVRRELVAIRDKVNILLDAIDGHPKGTAAAAESREGRTVTAASSNTSSVKDVVAKTEPVYRTSVETSGVCVCVLCERLLCMPKVAREIVLQCSPLKCDAQLGVYKGQCQKEKKISGIFLTHSLYLPCKQFSSKR